MNTQPLLFRPGLLLRAEALVVLLTACAAFQLWFSHSWLLFAGLLFVPDLSLITYLRGPGRVASVVYNSVHSYVLPVLLGAVAFHLGRAHWEASSLIWICHIAFDRTLGFGLKYGSSFGHTHLQSAIRGAA